MLDYCDPQALDDEAATLAEIDQYWHRQPVAVRLAICWLVEVDPILATRDYLCRRVNHRPAPGWLELTEFLALAIRDRLRE